MKTYLKKPVEVKAIQFRFDNKDQVFNELSGQVAAGWEDECPIIKITTIHGEIAIVRIGDWIVCEEELGYYYPVKPEVFRKTYEEIA